MLINLSNHPSDKWSKKQMKASSVFGGISDIPFPQISPEADEQEIIKLAEEYFFKIKEILSIIDGDNLNAVHLMGEMTFCFALASLLIKSGIKCIASTSRRNSSEQNGKKISEFEFVKFRSYVL